MRKRLIAFISCIGMLLCLCSCSNQGGTAESTNHTTAATTAPTTQTTQPASTTEETTLPTKPEPIIHDAVIEVKGSSQVRFGNFETAIPDGLKIASVDDNIVILSANDGECIISIFAADVSMLTESKLREYLPTQVESFKADDSIRAGEEKVDGVVGQFDVNYNSYVEMTASSDIYVVFDTTMTDSWYSYTVIMYVDSESENASSYASTFVKFLGYAKYVGSEPRFDFVQ